MKNIADWSTRTVHWQDDEIVLPAKTEDQTALEQMLWSEAWQCDEAAKTYVQALHRLQGAVSSDLQALDDNLKPHSHVSSYAREVREAEAKWTHSLERVRSLVYLYKKA